ncbi:magnesium and cobalt transport protein CorA [Streptomyces sp. AJS327]|uniref:magnesium and cobalt transport protein CorA n=1 Tax=Streptomyces sp. AJS327 TaxID=2545265 RepID=UPI0015DDB3E9|nr:magnesium and cobalt transport protein CorA [Streptomyces sp. AJS327]MBA0050672.1 magnesium and cobalt transport protein CorA [Streptomyces sp. AJS327]
MLSVAVEISLYRDGRRVEAPPEAGGGAREALARAREEEGAFVWVGVRAPTEAEFARVTDGFGLHPLAVEDALRAHQRPKLEVYPDSLFLVLKPMVYDAERASTAVGELMLFAGDSFVVSVVHGPADPVTPARDRLEADPATLRQGPTAVLHAASDAVVDHYLEVVADLQDALDGLEEAVFAPAGAAAGGATASRIYAFKRQVLEFRRATSPLTGPMTRLAGAGVPFVHADSRPFFRDVGDHLTRVNDQVESVDRLLSDILAAYLAQVGVRQNDDMRKISAWAAMFAIPTAIAGVYGMNFRHMPELDTVWGYPVVLAVIATACLALFRIFKKRGWL